MILSYLNRPFLLPRSYAEQYDGTGTQALVLPNYPVTTLSSLVISGTTIPIAPQGSGISTFSQPFGYRFQPWSGIPPGDPAIVELIGFSYGFGNQSVVVTYVAGYQVTGETLVVPGTPFKYAPIIPWGAWATDAGVFYPDGTALTAVSSGTPNTGQYVPPTPDAASPVYTYLFATGDSGKTLTVNYGFVPADLEQAALETIAERAAYRQRVGIRSQSLAGQETISYDLSGLSKATQMILQPYQSVLPPPMGAAL
jgi:hypothetical protein